MFAFVTDSAPNKVKGIQLFGENVLWLPCAAHRLNLCVQDIFEQKEIEENQRKFYVKLFDNNGELRKKEIYKKEKESIVAINEAKVMVEMLLKDCRHLVGSFKHSNILQTNKNSLFS